MAGFPIYRDVESNSLRFTASKLIIISPAPDYVVLDPSGEEIVGALNSLVYWTSENSGGGGGGGGGSASANTYGDVGGIQFYNGANFGAVPDFRFNAGKLSVNAQGIFTGNVTVGNSAFFVDTRTNAVGINTNTLAHTLTVNGTAYFTDAVNVLSTLDVIGAVNTANTLTVAGAINALSTVDIVGAVNAVGGLSVLGNAAFDTDTLFIDAVNHRIGINTTTPAEGYVLDVAGTIRAEAFVGSGALDPTDFANGSIGYVKLLNSTPGHVLMINATGNVESIAISGEATLSPTGVLTLGTAGTLTVNALVANTLKVLNSLNALSTLGITGATNALGTLGVSGTLNALSAMNVLGALNALSTVEVLGVLTARSDVNIDSGTLFVDAVGNFVGLGNTSPAHRLRVEGATSLNGAVNALGALGITGATNALSTLGVAQATNLFSTLGVTGKITGFDQLEISGNAIFDTDTLYVDAVNHRVGIGNTNPGSPNKLVVTGRTLLQSSTGIPLRVGRTSTNYLDVSVNAAGHATLNVYNAGLETTRLGIDSHLMLNQNKTIYLEGATETSISATSSDPKSIVFVTAGDKTLLLANVTSTINSAIRTPNFVSQTSGWRISREGEADFRYIYADEMHVKNFIADLEQALAGGQIIGKSVAVLYQNFTIPAYGQQTTLAVEDLPGATGMAVFQNNDYVILRNFTRPSSGSLEVAECVGKVTNNINGLTGSDGVKYQTWTFTRDSGNNGGLASSGGTVEKGSLVIDYGVEGNGFYEVNAIDGLNACNSPYSQIVTWTGSPATAAASRVTRARLGNLRGITGQAEEYGLIAGNYNGNQYFRASNKAFDLYGIDLQLFSSSTTAAIVLKRGTANTNPYLAIGNAAPTSFTSGTGIWMGRDESVGTDVASAYRFRAGNPSGVRLSWNGSAVLLGSSSDESLVANSQGLYFFNGAETLGYLNNSEWLLGNTSSNHLVIQPTGVTLKEGATERGQFASTTRIGTPTGPRVEIKSDSVKIYKTDVGSPVAGVVLNSDGSGSLSTGNISWDTSGNFNMTGTMTATAGVIGGWTVNSSVIVKDTGTGATSAGLAPTDYPFYAGAVYSGRASAPFRVTPAGSLTATSGSIAGWTLGASTLTGGNITLNKDGDITVGLGEDVARISATDANLRLWIGSATPASAPFRVAANGEVTATRVKTLNVDQGSTFNGITTFNGGVNALSTLRVYDTVNAFGTVGVTGLFTAFGGSILTGAVNALSTLRVSQAANALSTLGVGGLFTALGNSRLTGAVNVISTLGITDATNALSTLGVGGVFTALNTSRLVGAVNVISTLGISDATNALSTLGVSGAFTALSTSRLVGNVNALALFGVTGAANALSTLGVGGTLTALGQLVVVANAIFDTDTLYVDAVNHRVGIGNTDPGSPNKLVVTGRTRLQSDTEIPLVIARNSSTYLEVSANAAGHAFLNMTSSAGADARIGFADHFMLNQDKRFYLEGATETSIYATSSNPKRLIFVTDSEEVLRLAKTTSTINSAIASVGAQSQVSGWQIDRTGAADFRSIYADELHVKNFIADLEQALAGGQIISKSVAVLYQNFTVPALGANSTLAVEDLPGANGLAVFQANDYVILRSFSRPASGSLEIAECVGKVANNTNGLTGADGVKYQTWDFTRDTGNNGGNATPGGTIEKGSLVIDYGVSGSGFYEVNAIDGLNACNSPYSQIVTWTDSPAAVADKKVVRTRLGNLKGIAGVGETGEYGLYAGDKTTNQYFRASNKAFDLYGIDLQMFSSSTTAAIVLKRGASNTNPYLAIGNAAPTSFTSGVGIWMGRDATVGSDIASAYRFRAGDPDGMRLSWNGSAVLVGNTTGENIVVNPQGLYFYNSAETLGYLSNKVWLLGNTSSNHLLINPTGVILKTGATEYGQFAATTRIGTATGPRVEIKSDSVKIYKQDSGTPVAGVVLNSDGSGSLATNNISWDTSGNFDITGKINATSGLIGGWTVNSTALVKEGTGATSAGLAPTDYPFYAGNTYANRASAPFRVTPAGSLTATSGTVGGWSLGTSSLSGGNITLDGAGDVTVGLGSDIARISATDTTWRIWVGSTVGGTAPFRVAANGEVHATRVKTLGVSGTSTFEGPVQFNGAVNVISTLGVTGATNALGTLGVSGVFTALGTSRLTGAVNTTSTLGVGGVFTALGTSTLTGAVNALGILGVTGAVNALNTFGVSGAANALSTLGVTGVFTALNTSTLTGAVNVLSTLGVTQAANALSTLGVGGTLTALGQLVVVANATFDTDTLFVDAVNNRVGVGTTTLSTRAQVGPKVTLDNSYSYDTDALYVIHQTGTSATALNDPKEVLLLSRQGTTGQATGAAASFRLSRYENVSTNSRTRFDLVLAHDGFLTSPITALTAFSNGSIGIGTTAPRGLLSVANTTGGVTYEAVIRPRSAASGTGLAAGADVASYEQVLNLAGDVLNGSSSGGVNIGTYASGAWRRALSIRNAGNLLLMPDGFGNVGVGNATPTHLLRVEGTTSINGAFTTDTTARFGGATNALTTFGVTGAANALNTLGVSGAFTALSTSTLTGAANALNTLGVAGTLTALGQLVVVGNATFDTNTLFVDAVNDRVGIGNNTPGAPNKLVVDGRTLLQSDTETVQLRVAKNTANYLDVTINSAGHAYLNMTSLADAGGTTRVGFAEHIMLDQNKRIYLEGSTSTSIRGVDATSSINFTTGNEETLKIASPQSTINSALVSGPSIPYASRTTGWGIDRIGGADFRYIYADEMHVKSFIADLEQALAGGQIISKSVAVLYENFTAPANGAPATLKVEYLPGAPSMPVFEANDYVVLRSFTRQNGGLTVGDCVGVVTNPNTDIAAYQSWTFTRAGTGNAGSMPSGTVVKANTLVLDYGTSGSGYYEVTAVDGLYAQNAPYSQIVTWVDSPISTNRTVRARLGNLRGITSSEGEYGLIAGTYGGNQYFRASNKAFDLYGIDLQLFSSSTTAAIVLKRGASNTNPYIAIGNAAPTSFTSGVGVWMGRDATVGSDIESAYRFRVGDPSGDRLSWNGSAVLIGNPTNSHLVANAGVLTFRVSSETHASLSGSEWVLGRTGTNHLVINATGISLNNAGTQYAQFAADTRLGVQTDNHLLLNSSAILFRSPSGAANLVSINSTSVTVGSNTDFHVRVTNTAVTLNQGTTEYGQFAANTRLGTTSANHLLVNATALMFRDGTSANLATMNATAIEIGTSSTSRTVINTSGVILFTGATEYARFAANTRLGVNNTNHLLLTNSEIIFRTSDLQNKNLATINATTIVMGQTDQFHTLINASTVTLRSNQTDYAQFAVVTRIGPNTSNHLLLSDTALMFRNENSANLATMNSTALVLGNTSTSQVVVNTTGVTLLNNNSDYAQFAAITRVGTSTGPRVVIANTGVQIYKDATVAGVVLYSNGAGSLSTGNISWDSSGNFNMTGNVTATAGSIGPWAVNSTAIARETSNPATSAGLAPDDYPFYSGAFFANRSTAPFRVNRSGEVYATNLNHAGGTLSDLLITGKLEIYPGADIRSGATSFTTGNGYWLQQNTTGTFMRVGDPANNQIQWNNTQLEIRSNLLKINSTSIFLPVRTTFAIDQQFAYGFSGQTDTKYGTYAFEGVPAGISNDNFRALRQEVSRTSSSLTTNTYSWSALHGERIVTGLGGPNANVSAEVAAVAGIAPGPATDVSVRLITRKEGGDGYAKGRIELDGGLHISTAAYGLDTGPINANNGLIGLKVYIGGVAARIIIKAGHSD